MAGKEGTIIILDCNKSMADKYLNTDMTKLDFGKESIHHLIRQKLLFTAKKDQVGIILKGCQPDEEEEREGIHIFKELDFPSINLLNELNDITVSDNNQDCDIFDSIDVAIDTFIDTYKKLKWAKKIFLITDGEAECKATASRIEKIADKLNENDIKVNIIAVDFFSELDEDDEEESEEDDVKMKEGDKDSSNQIDTKNALKKLVDKTDNVKIFTARMANYIYHQFRKKKINPVTKFRGPLILTPNLSLDVMVYTKTTTQNLPSLSKYSLATPFNDEPGTCGVINERLYYIHDDPQQIQIQPEFIAKAYYYGNSLVPVSKTDEIRFKNEEMKCLKTIGFTDAFRVPRHFYMGGVDLVMPNPTNEKVIGAFKAIVEEMIKMNKVIIARYVYRTNSDPKLVVLIPHLAKKGPVFYLNTLPTIEDIRDYQFESLTNCTKNQEELVSKFIDSLDLGEGDEEQLKPSETYNPILQYFYQCLESKALSDDKEIPPLDEEIKKYLIPNKELFEANKFASFMPKLFVIKEKAKKDEKKKRVFWKDVISNEMMTGLTQQKIEEKLNEKKKEAKKTISAITPIEDFKEMIGNKTEDLTVLAIDLMKKMIERFILDSFKGSYYIRAIECIKALRDAANDEDEVDLFNTFLQDLKTKYPKDQFLDFWLLFTDNNITLISKEENPKSAFCEKECKEWLNSMKKKEVITSTLDDINNLLLDID